MLELLFVLAVVTAVVTFVAAPLRPGYAAARDAAAASERAELEAAREAKYREIREAELDYRTGKLSEADWRALDRSLRAEAVALLHRLDALDGAGAGAAAAGPEARVSS
jgi:hypothetical protein